MTLPKRSITSRYNRELDRLPLAIDFACNMPIAPLANMIGSLANKPLLAVGSGGSFTVATLAAMLHESTTRQLGKASTPYQSLANTSLLDANAILISAGGRNSDSIAAFRGLSKRITGKLVVVTASPDSRLARLAFSINGSQPFSFRLPFARDGFLATNSLVATSLLLARAYHSFSGDSESECMNLTKSPHWSSLPEDNHLIKDVVTQETVIVLAGSWAWPAAVDLESKFSEAGLTHIQLVDYRNFAHGRHFWLAKRGGSTAVVALSCPDTEDVVTRTLSTLPDNAKSLVLRTDLRGAAGTIDLLCKGMYLTGLAGESLEASLARPGVPAFGRRLYNVGFKDNRAISLTDVCVARKVMATGIRSNEALDRTRNALKEFLTGLSSSRVEALVTDYDGTIYDRSRFQTLPTVEIQKELLRLLEDGLILGVATGRGEFSCSRS